MLSLPEAEGLRENDAQGRNVAEGDRDRIVAGMHFLYVDESGDLGSNPGASPYFILCGLLVHHTDWRATSAAIRALRGRLEDLFGFACHSELHAAEFLGRNDRHLRLARNVRFRCALHIIGFLAKHPQIKPIRIVVNKSPEGGSVRVQAWESLLSESNRTVSHLPPDRYEATRLIVICDDHRSAPRQAMLKEMQTERIAGIIEQPLGMDSRDAQLLQLADLLAYLTKQEIMPSKSFSGKHSRRILLKARELFTRRVA